MENEIIHWISQDKSQLIPVILSSFISATVAVLGWIAIYFLNSRQQKKSLKNNAKMKIYEELSKLVADYNKKSIELSVAINTINTTFIGMKYVDRKLDVVQRNYEGIKKWQNKSEQIGKNIVEFSISYQEVWDYVTYWISAMPKLKGMNQDLFWHRYGNLTRKLWEFKSYMQDLSINEFYWEKWNREEIDMRIKEISKEIDVNSGYFDDLMTDIHNILVGKIFGHLRKKRENFANLPESYKILTSNGLKNVKSVSFFHKLKSWKKRKEE